MALTDSLDAATQQVLALLAQIKTSNARIIQGQDSGSADNILLNPAPSVGAYGPDLLILADIAAPNQTTTPKLNVSSIGQVTVTANDGSPVALGAVSGKCLFGFSSAVAGAYTARLLFSVPAALNANNLAVSGARSINGLLPVAMSGGATNAAISIAAGSCGDITGTVGIKSSAQIAWSVSNGAAVNGFADGATLPNSATIHIFACKGASGVGTFASVSPTPPLSVFPPGYNLFYRRIFSVLTDASGNLVVYSAREIEGGALYCTYTGKQIIDLSSVTPPSNARQLYAMTVPTGISVGWEGGVQPAPNSNDYTIYVASPDEPDVPVGVTNFGTGAPGPFLNQTTFNVGQNSTGGGRCYFEFFAKSIITNTAGQIGMRGEPAPYAPGQINAYTFAFKDFRR